MRRAVSYEDDGGRKTEGAGSNLQEEDEGDAHLDDPATSRMGRRGCRREECDVWCQTICSWEEEERTAE